MSPEKWARVCVLLDSLAELPADRQTGELARAQEDPTVLAEVRRLLSGLSQASGFLSQPVASAAELLSEPHRLRTGQLIAGRFQIREFLGAGGMGEVYSAQDRSLRETVGLKTIRVEWAGDDDMVERFYREVQVARRVTHESVCRIFELGRDDIFQPAVVFLTMQLLSGGSLHSRLRSAAVPISVSQRWMLQVTRGLAAAHQAGVLHRDLKPANILLTGEAQSAAVITDFGLALDVSPSAPFSSGPSVHQLAGTPLYLAPERLQSEPATASADVYALGLVMYEVFSGQLPFAERPPLSSILKRSRMRPPSLANHGLPPEWDRVMLRCLDPQPELRYRDACEVLRDLEGSQKSRVSRLSRRSWIAATALLGVSSSSVGLRYWSGSWIPALSRNTPTGHQVLLVPWEIPGEPELQSLEVPMRQMMAQSGQIDLWSQTRLTGVLERMGRPAAQVLTPAEWREVALREQVRLLLFGTAARLGDGYTLSMRLEQVNPTTPRQAARSWTRTFEARDRGGLFDALHEGAVWVRKAMGEPEGAIAVSDRLPQDITTGSWDALAAFSRAEKLALGLTDKSTALREFDLALRYDPEFTMAWMRKGDLLMGMERMSEGLSAWQTAISLSGKRPLTVREDLKLRAMFADDTSDYRQSEKLFGEYVQRYPDDSWGYFNRELPLTMLGLDDEAIAMLLACERFPERHAAAWLHLAWLYVGKGDPGQVAERVSGLRQAGFPDRAFWAEAVQLYAKRNTELALDRVRRSAAVSAPFARSLMCLREVLVLADAGRNQDALTLAQTYATEDMASGLRSLAGFKGVAAAYLLLEQSMPERAIAVALQAGSPDDGSALQLHLGTIFARGGRRDLAQAILARIEGGLDVPRTRIVVHRLRGEIALATRQWKTAVAEMRAAAVEDLLPYGHEYLARTLQLSGDTQGALAEYRGVAKARLYELRLLYPEAPGVSRRADQFIKQKG